MTEPSGDHIGLSIRWKLVLMQVATTALVLVLFTVAGAEFNRLQAERALEDQSRSTARMLAFNVIAPLRFGDDPAAREVLLSVASERQVVKACVLDNDGEVFAVFSRPGHEDQPCVAESGADAGDRFRWAREDITAGGTKLGTVVLRVENAAVRAARRSALVFGLLALIAALAASAVVAVFMQGLVSRPLTDLLAAVRSISRTRDYTLRVEMDRDDELGILARQFNEMLSRIRERDVLLQADRDELEQRVAERTKELEQSLVQLVRARDEAMAADQAKSEFLASMSHELRTPLNAVIGYSEILEEDAADRGDETAVQDLKRIYKAARHLLGLINDVLDFSKIESGRMKLNVEDISIKDLSNGVVETVRPLAKDNGNEFVVELGVGLGTAPTDPMRLRQILFNLLSNSFKFTDGGRVRLKVDRDPSEEFFVFEVSDTGIGMTDEQLQRVFDPFVQADGSTTRKYGGTGLGLTLSQRLAELLGGELTLESELGKGTVCRVRIPANDAPPGSGKMPSLSGDWKKVDADSL